MISKRQRNFGLLCLMAALGILSLFAIPAQAQGKISVGVDMGPATMVAMRAEMPTQQKALELTEAKPFRFLFRADNVTACQEFPANGKTAVSAAGFEVGKQVDLTVKPGYRWYPKQGESKYVVVRCVSADQAHTIISDSIRISRK